MTEHNLSDELAMSYAAGALPPAFAAVVASHCALSDDSRALVCAYEAVGGAVLETGETAPLADGAYAAVLQRVRAGTRAMPKRPVRGVFPEPLRAIVGGDLDAVKWKSAGGGVKQAILIHEKGASLRLLSIPGGAAMPEHGHRGLELTLVLQGAFADGEQRFARGDLEIADPSDQHIPIAEPGETCICLAATDAPLRFVTLLPRLAQPFIRI